MTGKERRRDPRVQVLRPVKTRCAESGKFYAGRMRNVSAGGALLEIDHPSLMVPGQPIRLGVAWADRQVVLDAGDMIDATVVRSLGRGPTQHVAVQFAQRHQELVAA